MISIRYRNLLESLLKKTVKEWIEFGVDLLSSKVERPRLECEVLLSHDLDVERIWLHAHENDSRGTNCFENWIYRRAAGEPLEYLTGVVSFYGEMFHVNHGVLIPRPETELLIEHVGELIEKHRIQTLAEIGVGSGIISIMLAKKFPQLKIIATDISDAALLLSEKNIAFHGVEKQITLLKSNLLDVVENTIDAIVSNPPYIADDFALPDNVKHEPEKALFGGVVGDEILKEIIDLGLERNVKFIACEMGYDQRDRIKNHTLKSKINVPEFYRDLAGLDRGFVIEY